jgi:hypothetical protein
MNKLLKTKWNIKRHDRTLISRLISELEGASYLLEAIDKKDYDIVQEMRSKYYKHYFSLPKE